MVLLKGFDNPIRPYGAYLNGHCISRVGNTLGCGWGRCSMFVGLGCSRQPDVLEVSLLNGFRDVGGRLREFWGRRLWADMSFWKGEHFDDGMNFGGVKVRLEMDGTGVEKGNKKYTEKLKDTSSKGQVTYVVSRGIAYMTLFEKRKRFVSQLAGTNHREKNG